MTSQILEDKIIAALAEVCSTPQGVAFQGSWTPATETPGSGALVTVVVSTPSSPTYTAPQLTYQGSVAIAVRIEQDPTASDFLALANAVSSLLSRWQGETYQQAFTALDIDGDDGEAVLSVDEISIDAAKPEFDLDTGIHSITFPFTLQATSAPVG